MALIEPPAPTAPVSIRVEDLHIRYRVYEEQRMSTRQIFSAGLRSRGSTEVHAVRGVSFEIFRGEAVGIIGPNGSGKSTLLRAIAGLQPKASGNVLLGGEPQLLSVASSFKPELSGLRNVMLGGLAMGLTLDEVEARLPDVVEFSGLGDAIRRPIKTYSSGMRARLGFSIATLKVPEILLIDEALAVGDADFRDRSLRRVNEIREAANTVVMVTHNLTEVRRTCTRALWIENGFLVADGDVELVIAGYVEAHSA